MSTGLVQTHFDGMEQYERPAGPLAIVQQALERGIDAPQLNALMDFAERMQANQAKAAFYAAMKRFKDSPPKIVKRGEGHNKAKYTKLDDACGEIIPALAKVGISHSWKTKVVDGKVSVKCVLTHEMGFSDPEPPEIEAGADTSGNKNANQALGSSIKYLERYTLFAACGLDDGTPDTDGGKTTQGEGMDEKAFAGWMEKIQGATSGKELTQHYIAAITAAGEAGDRPALHSFANARTETWRQNGGFK